MVGSDTVIAAAWVGASRSALSLRILLQSSFEYLPDLCIGGLRQRKKPRHKDGASWWLLGRLLPLSFAGSPSPFLHARSSVRL